MPSNLYTAILMSILSAGLGCPVYNETNKQNDPKPIEIVVECECRDVTDKED